MTYLLLILSVVLGAFLGSFFGKNQNLAKKLLVVSAGFLITICFQEIFPSVYEYHDHHIGLFVIFGVLVQLFLESLTQGFEHGHIHHHEDKDNKILPIALTTGLFIHAFIEGIPLYQTNDFSFSQAINDPYLMGILVHNLPISFILGSFLFSKKQKHRASSYIIISLFALSSPIGMLLGQYLSDEWHRYFLAIVAGIFIHISAIIIFENDKNHQMNWNKIFLVLVGVGIAYLSHLGHHHH